MDMRSAEIAANIMGIMICLILIVSSVNARGKRKKTIAFSIFAGVSLMAIVLETAAVMTMGMPSEFAWKTAAYVMPNLAIASFYAYLYIHAADYKVACPHTPFIIGITFTVIMSLVVGVLCLYGQMFSIVDGRVLHGPAYPVYIGSYLAMIVFLVTLTVSLHRVFGWHDVIAVVVYIAFPTLSMTIHWYYENINFNYATIGLVTLIMYVMLQTEKQQSMYDRYRLAASQAHQDELTGMNNRLAFNEALDSMNGDKMLGVLFCDLNGLKYTNDHFGHVAGDEHICNLANVLMEQFGKHQTFRISGDEFVALLEGVTEKEFFEQIRILKEAFAKFEFPIACVGAELGRACESQKLLSVAEENMYKEKEIFYNKYELLARK